MIAGFSLGILGATWHLAVLRWRVGQIALGQPARAWLALPVGLAGPAFGALLAVRLAGGAGAVAFLVGALATTAVVLRRAP